MDLNTILNAALTAAVAEVTAPMLSRISSLESRLFATERVADTEPTQLVEMSISGFDDLAARIAASQLRINAIFTLLNAIIRTDDRAVELADENDVTLKNGFVEKVLAATYSQVEGAMEAHHASYDHDEFYKDSDTIFDDIESRVESKIEAMVSDDLRDAVMTIIRDDLDFSITVS